MIRGEVTWEAHRAYFGRVLADDSQRVFAVMADNRHVGNCGLKNLNQRGTDGELWIYIGEASARGRGIGREATRLLVSMGFSRLGLGKIYLHVADFNLAARNMYRSLGFEEVCLDQDGHDWADRGCEIIRMELTKP